MRPFIPDKANALPANWKVILRSWVSGEEVAKTVHCWIFERPGHAAGRAAHSHH